MLFYKLILLLILLKNFFIDIISMADFGIPHESGVKTWD